MNEKIAPSSDQTKIDHTPAGSSVEAQLSRLLARVPPMIRLPKPGQRCPYCQLSRSGLLDLIAPTQRNEGKPPVEAIYRRAHRYAERGIWLIPTENLFRYLLGLGGGTMAEHGEADKLRHAGESDET